MLQRNIFLPSQPPLNSSVMSNLDHKTKREGKDAISDGPSLQTLETSHETEKRRGSNACFFEDKGFYCTAVPPTQLTTAD